MHHCLQVQFIGYKYFKSIRFKQSLRILLHTALLSQRSYCTHLFFFFFFFFALILVLVIYHLPVVDLITQGFNQLVSLSLLMSTEQIVTLLVEKKSQGCHKLLINVCKEPQLHQQSWRRKSDHNEIPFIHLICIN